MRRQTTRDLLAGSFLELAETKPINKITITNITDNCGMSQPVFYHYFKDKYDLIVWIYCTSAQKIMGRIGTDGYRWRDTLRDAAKYYAENRDFAINALQHTNGHDSFLRQVEQTNIALLSAEVAKALRTEQIPQNILGMIKVYCYGTVQFMFEWLIENMPISQEQVVEIWEKSLPQPLRKYLYEEPAAPS